MFARAVCLLRRCETKFVSHIFQKMLPVIFYFMATSKNVFYSLVHSVTNAVRSLVTQNKKKAHIQQTSEAEGVANAGFGFHFHVLGTPRHKNESQIEFKGF